MHQFAFSSRDLPGQLDDATRYRRWYEAFEALTISMDYVRMDDRPFAADFQWARYGDTFLTHFSGTIKGIARSRETIRHGPDDDYCLSFNCSDGEGHVTHMSREGIVAANGALLTSNGAPVELALTACAWNTITISRRQLLGLVRNADDLLGRPFEASRPAIAHLRRYIGHVVDLRHTPYDPALERHIATTLLDLTALALGAGRDVTEMAKMRGLRQARAQDILNDMRRNFANPAYSVAHVSRRLGVSTRFVQDLLQELGASFTERVIELRMQAARAMLIDPRRRDRKISEIALACGFNEVSYFNQRFRRRFGESPSQCRAGAAD